MTRDVFSFTAKTLKGFGILFCTRIRERRASFLGSAFDVALGIFSVVLISGCQAKGSKLAPNDVAGVLGSATSKIRIVLPGTSASTLAPTSGTQSFRSASTDSSGTSNSQNYYPTTLAEFDCFAVNVIASDIQTAPACGGAAPMGIAAGFIHRGVASSIDLDVPFGRNRVFQVWGFAHSSSCSDVVALLGLPLGALPGGFNSPGFLLAEQEVDVLQRDMTVNLNLGFAFGTNRPICGTLPSPTTHIVSVSTQVGATPISDGQTLAAVGTDVCIKYTTSAISPSAVCTQTITTGAVTTTSAVSCTDNTGCPAFAGGHAFRLSSSVAGGAKSTFTIAIQNTDQLYGLIDPSPPVFRYTFDNVAPTLNFLSITPGKADTASPANYYTGSANPIATLTTSKPATIDVNVNGGGWSTCNIVRNSGIFNCRVSLAGGSPYTVQFRATDSYTNTSTISETIYTDFVAPVLSIQATDSPSTATGWLMGGDMTSGSAANTSGFYNAIVPVATDTYFDSSSLVCDINTGLSFGTRSSCTSGTALDFSSTLKGGKHTLTLTGRDLGGNAASSYSVSVYIDNLLYRTSTTGPTDATVVGRTKSNYLSLVDESANTTTVTPLPGGTGLNTPGQSVLDDQGGMLYVADVGGNRVLGFPWDTARGRLISRKATVVLGQANTETYISGVGTTTGTSNAGSTITYEKMNNPVGLALGIVSTSVRKLFVSDMSNNRVLRYDISSAVTTNTATTYVPGSSVPDGVFGQPSDLTTTANNGGTSVGLSTPMGLTYYNNYLYIADTANCRIAVYSNAATATIGIAGPAPTIYSHVGNNGVAVGGALAACPAAPAGNAGQNLLARPQGVAIDGSNNALFVADTYNNRVLQYSLTSILVPGNPNATAVYGRNTSTDWNTSTTASANPGVAPSYPQGIAVVYDGYQVSTSPYLAVSQTSGDGEMIKFYAAGTAPVPTSVYTSWGSSAGTTRSSFNLPAFMSYNSNTQNLLVADLTNNRTLLYNTSTLAQSTSTAATDVIGHSDATGSYRSFTAASSNNPNDANLNAPTYAVADTTFKRLYVSDTTNNRVLVYPLNASTLKPSSTRAIAVLGVPLLSSDSSPMLDSKSSGYPAAANTLYQPKGLALDGSGRLFVADTGNNRVLRFPTNTTLIASGISADLVLGQSGSFGSTSTGVATTSFSGPTGVAYNPIFDVLYVTDTGNNRVSVWGPMVSQSPAPIGPGYFGSAGTTKSTFSSPTGISYTNGNGTTIPQGLFVADTGNHRVMFFELSTSSHGVPQDIAAATASACFGHRDRGGGFNTIDDMCQNEPNAGTLNDGGGIMPTANGTYGLYSPQAAYFSETSPARLYVSDAGNSRVVVYDMTQNYNQPTVAYNTNLTSNQIFHAVGAEDLISTIGGSVPLKNNMSYPTGIFVLVPSSGPKLLYVTDQNFSRVGVYEVP